MKILAVSDVPSKSLEHVVENNPGKLKALDLILSCGDLNKDYLEFLAEGLHKNLFFVCGNHPLESCSDEYFEKANFWEDSQESYIAGTYDLHGRIEKHKDYLIVGFGGSHWYSGRGNEYKEKEMAKVVKQVLKNLERIGQNTPLQSTPQKIIVISHAPPFHVHDQKDPCHTGFKCFHDFIKKASPILWIHGHVHLESFHNNQVTIVGNTTVVNSYCYKYINIEPKEIKISYNLG